MAKEKDRTPPTPPDNQPAPNDVATIKTKVRVARVLEQIAAMRGVNKQDVLDSYVEQFEDDLADLMAARQAELKRRQPPPGQRP